MFTIKLDKFLVIILLLSSSLIYGAERADGDNLLKIKNNDFVNENFLRAVGHENFESVKQAIASGADVNFRDPKSGITPLDASILNTNLEIIKFLLDNGANVNGPGNLGYIPLVRAAAMQNITIIKMLLAKGANIDAFNVSHIYYYSVNSLMMAASTGNIEAVVTLLLAGADINVKDPDGNNALQHALKEKEFGTAAVLQAWPEIKKIMEDEVAAQLDETGILLGDLNKIVAEYAVGYPEEKSKESSEK